MIMITASPILDSKTFQDFASLIADKSGIQLSENRNRMLQNRISSRVKQLGLESFQEYFNVVVDDCSGSELRTLIDSVTTNYTSFFRDARQFDILRDSLIALIGEGRRKIRIWSTACSSGEEPYSIAITVREAMDQCEVQNIDVRILATDISMSMLQKTSDGFFSDQAVRMLSAEQQRHFSRPSEVANGSCRFGWQISPRLRKMVMPRMINLCDIPSVIPGDIDFIFCRNVLIYFDVATQRKILRSCMQKLASDGLLFVGACESVRKLIPDAPSVHPSVFTSRKSQFAASLHPV